MTETKRAPTESTCPYCLVDGKKIIADNARLREALLKCQDIDLDLMQRVDIARAALAQMEEK